MHSQSAAGRGAVNAWRIASRSPLRREGGSELPKGVLRSSLAQFLALDLLPGIPKIYASTKAKTSSEERARAKHSPPLATGTDQEFRGFFPAPPGLATFPAPLFCQLSRRRSLVEYRLSNFHSL